MNLSAMKKIGDFDAAGKRVLMRIDADVPVKNGEIQNDKLIRRILPTVEYLLSKDARVLLMGHMGAPGGRVVPHLSMEPFAKRLAELLPSGEVFLTDACVGDGAKRVALDLRDGEVAVLENLAFHVGEESNDEKFARELASFGEIYINESPKTLNRNAASTASAPKYVAKRGMGFLLDAELAALSHFLGKVERPFVAVLGGADLSSKISLLQYFMEKADTIVIGGAPSNTFLAARGASLGKSAVEESRFPLARDLIAKAASAGIRLLLPTDVVLGDDSNGEAMGESSWDAVPSGLMVQDIGSQTRAAFKEAISRAATVFWNGPMGNYQNDAFFAGTLATARAIAGSSAFSVAGGDDTAEAVLKTGLEKGFDQVSNGGVASLELLEGKVLPGIGALETSTK
jgi:phosphoglycerate kinase